VAGRVHGLERPVLTGYDVAVAQAPVGLEAEVEPGIEGLAICGLNPWVTSIGKDRGGGDRLQALSKRRVVAMAMGDHDVAHRLAADRRKERLEMIVVVRAGVDDRHVAVADDVADRSGERVRAGVAAHDAAHQAAHWLRRAVGHVEVAFEGEFRHGEIRGCISLMAA
jgi:hypothetical protein